jgi:long-subunit acyl-CoA synthetase (AMP-forming)
MNVEIGHFFSDLGIPVYDCYGLTETTPAATMNGPLAHKPGSVGRPIEHVRVEIDKMFSDGGEDGEIIIYGPNVMQGYHNKPEATKEVMTEDGGFRTGDRGDWIKTDTFSSPVGSRSSISLKMGNMFSLPPLKKRLNYIRLLKMQ